VSLISFNNLLELFSHLSQTSRLTKKNRNAHLRTIQALARPWSFPSCSRSIFSPARSNTFIFVSRAHESLKWARRLPFPRVRYCFHLAEVIYRAQASVVRSVWGHKCYKAVIKLKLSHSPRSSRSLALFGFITVCSLALGAPSAVHKVPLRTSHFKPSLQYLGHTS